MSVELKFKCIKDAKPCFTVGLTYFGDWFYNVVTSPPQLKVIDDMGHRHIIAEGDKTDEWFKEHFEVEEE